MLGEKAFRRLQLLAPASVLLLAVGLRLARSELLAGFQSKTLDAFQTLGPRPYEDAPVRVVDIDDESVARLGPWPWPRDRLAGIVSRLSSLGASVIALDVVFPEPDKASPEQLLDLLPRTAKLAGLRAGLLALPSHDRILAKALAGSKAVTGFTLTHERNASLPELKAGVSYAGDDPRRFLSEYPGAIVNLPLLEQAASGNGNLSFEPERDGVVRRVPLLSKRSGELFPSLALEALRVHQGEKAIAVRCSGARLAPGFGQHTGIVEVKTGSFVLPTDGSGRFWLHYTGRAPGRTIPAWRVLEPGFTKEAVAGRIVFIGASALRLMDLHATPLEPRTPGVEIQAQVAEQALLGHFLRRPDWADGAEAAYLLALGLALILLLPRLGAASSGWIGLCVVLSSFPLSWLAFKRFHCLIDPLYPSLAALAVYSTSSLLSYLRSEAERRRLALLDKVKDELILMVSHDLRSPVNAMVMVADAMLGGLIEPANQKNALEQIRASGMRLGDFVTNILDAAKIRAGKLALQRGEVRLRELVAPLIDLLQITARNMAITLELDIPEGLPPVHADRGKLEEVINNLVYNALKFTPKGGRVAVSAAVDADGFARLSVNDTGRGIAPEHIPKLFKDFSQAEPEPGKGRSTGLGLSICKALVEAHGGRIWVESTPGAGSAFYFTIPLWKG